MQHVVGIADMKISKNPEDSLITHALGSCLGVTLHDSITGVGGMIHIMLPMSKIDKEKARKNPFMFVDTGIPELFKKAYTLGAKKENITVKVAGGAKILDAANRFNIGERNYILLRKILWKNNVLIDSEDVGGGDSRTLSLSVSTGTVTIRTNGQAKEL
ncbi:MAG: chemotaxis protein CheD [Gemmatimonadetes bacterium]|jgi:chemotaxis protein CheD|nr:chemotaxis protein CheD [Gemmatimonadota bacterium]